MASILNNPVTVFRGRLHLAEPDIEIITRGGLDGVGVVYDGWRAAVAEITTRTLCSTLPILTDAVRRYRATVGQTGTVIDGPGVLWPNCLVVTCGRFDYDQRLDGGWILTAQWQILPEGGRPA